MSVNLYNATTDTLKNVAGDIINPKSVNNTIAPTEETTTASRAYNIGEQFFLNDVLYKATANIAQGDTITVGTNCEESEQLSKQVEDIKSDLTEKGKWVLLKILTSKFQTLDDITDYNTIVFVTLDTSNVIQGSNAITTDLFILTSGLNIPLNNTDHVIIDSSANIANAKISYAPSDCTVYVCGIK